MSWGSKSRRLVEILANLLLLNLLWLLTCLPVLTIYPATAAMFGTVREWVRKKEPVVTKAFFSSFKANFKQSFWIGIVWTFLGGFLLVSFGVVDQMLPGLRFFAYAWFSLLGFLYVFASMFLFPVMVSYETSWWGVLKNSLLLSVGRLATTIQCLLIVGASVTILLAFPITLLILGSVATYAIYWLCDRAFQTIAPLRDDAYKPFK